METNGSSELLQTFRNWINLPLGTQSEQAAAYIRLKGLLPDLMAEIRIKTVENAKLVRRVALLEFDCKNLKTLADRRARETEDALSQLKKAREEHQREFRSIDTTVQERQRAQITAKLDLKHRELSDVQEKFIQLRAENVRLLGILEQVKSFLNVKSAT